MPSGGSRCATVGWSTTTARAAIRRRMPARSPERRVRDAGAGTRSTGDNRAVKLLVTTLRLAGRSLERNPLRSALTSLGVIVGVAAVIAMVSLGQGARAALQAQIASAGTNLVMVFPGASTTAGARSGWAEGVVSLTAGDAEAIERQVPGLLAVSWFKRGVAQVQAGGQNWSTTIWGVPPSYTRVRDWPVVSGDFISDSQDDTAAK